MARWMVIFMHDPTGNGELAAYMRAPAAVVTAGRFKLARQPPSCRIHSRALRRHGDLAAFEPAAVIDEQAALTRAPVTVMANWPPSFFAPTAVIASWPFSIRLVLRKRPKEELNLPTAAAPPGIQPWCSRCRLSGAPSGHRFSFGVGIP